MFIVQHGVHESEGSQTEHRLKFSGEWFYLMRCYPVLRAEEIVNLMQQSYFIRLAKAEGCKGILASWRGTTAIKQVKIESEYLCVLKICFFVLMKIGLP